MIDLSKIYHIGQAVSDLEAAKKTFSAAYGLEWAPTRTFDPLPFWTPERGKHDVFVEATYSRTGPVHYELVKGTGEFYDPARKPDSRHFGVWVDDLTAEAERLLSQGWTPDAAALPPEEGFGVIAYFTPPTGGVMVELVSRSIEPAINDWING